MLFLTFCTNLILFFFFFNDTATTEIYTLSLHDALPIYDKLKVIDGHEVRTIFIGLDQHNDELLFSSVKGKNPFKDARVRQALNMAVDREAIKRVTMRGLSIPAGLMVAPGVHGHSQELDKPC